jgi:hypothetical protein
VERGAPRLLISSAVHESTGGAMGSNSMMEDGCAIFSHLLLYAHLDKLIVPSLNNRHCEGIYCCGDRCPGRGCCSDRSYYPRSDRRCQSTVAQVFAASLFASRRIPENTGITAQHRRSLWLWALRYSSPANRPNLRTTLLDLLSMSNVNP